MNIYHLCIPNLPDRRLKINRSTILDFLIHRIWMWKNLPLQGSFLTKNSSSATQPPPTRTITVDLKIRTRRSF